MRTLTALSLTVSVLAVAPAVQAQQNPPAASEPVVVVTGEGLVQAVPDRAWITIAAESRAPNPRDAQRRNTDAMRPVLAALQAARIPSDAIRTVGYDLQQEWDFVNNRRVSRGYVARNTIDVRVDDVTRVAELLELSVGSGATSVSGLRFDLKDRAKLENDALRLAVAGARAKAEAAAAGAGRTIDRIVRIDEQGARVPPPVPMMMRSVAQDAGGGDPPPIAAGQIEIRATVTVTAALK